MSREVDPPTEEDAGLRHALDASLTGALWRRAYAILLAGPRSSSEADRLATAYERSVVASAARWLADATRHASLYRWLTAEPEPDVIVIDLRETYTVGPVVALLDRLLDALAPVWRHSSCKRATDGVATVAVWAARTRPGRLLLTFLEPPEPRESRDEE